MRAEYFPGRTGGFYWRLVGGNNEKMFQSQRYPRKWNAKRAATRLGKLLNCPVVEVDA